MADVSAGATTMKILMVSPFPPLRDGVGKYAAQEVAALRAEGHEVEVLAPVACAADHVEDFKTWIGGLAKLRGYARRYDQVILQYQPCALPLARRRTRLAWCPTSG